MKKQLFVFLLYAVLSTAIYAGQLTQTGSNLETIQSHYCSDTGCSGNAIRESETPGAIAEKKGVVILNDILENGTDKDRWAAFTLHSQDTNPGELKIMLVKSAGLEMRLEPKTGLLYFERKNLKQAFAIARPARPSTACSNEALCPFWRDEALCPRYGVQIIDGSLTHAVIAKYCLPFEYDHGKNFHRAEEYYLYDMKTASMRGLFISSIEDKAIHGPLVQPAPILKKIADGYQLDWKFHDAAQKDEIAIHNSYLYAVDKKQKKPYLICKDLTTTSDDGNMCDGPEDLRLILDQRGSAK